jgi:hypothetical protein
MWQGVTPSPDPTFMRKLKEYDRRLDCHFDRKLERFVITQRGKVSGRVPFLVVDDPNLPHYRQPDTRELAEIHMADMWNKIQRGWKEAVQEGEDYILGYEEKQDKKTKEEIHEVTKDNKHWLRKKYQQWFNQSKGTRPFRQVTPKPKGKVFAAH